MHNFKGETGAGKTSFINLLLGTSILPTASLPCTATICELRTCQDARKSAILTFRVTDNGTRMQPKTLDLQTATGLRELAECIGETDPYYGESPYDKIQINWPFPILQVLNELSNFKKCVKASKLTFLVKWNIFCDREIRFYLPYHTFLAFTRSTICYYTHDNHQSVKE